MASNRAVSSPAAAPSPRFQRSTVTIRRDHPEDARQRRISARLDSGANHDFTYGHAVTIELPPGAHAIRIGKRPYHRIVTFNLEVGEHVTFTLIDRPSSKALRPLVRWGWAPGKISVLRTAEGPTTEKIEKKVERATGIEPV